MAALADPTRLRVIERLASGPKTATQLAEGFSISRPAVSQHLRTLREAGLVTVERQGTQRIYAVHAESLGELRAYLDQLWGGMLASLAEPD